MGHHQPGRHRNQLRYPLIGHTMNTKTGTRLICDELTRRTGHTAINLGKGNIELTSPRRLRLRVLSPPSSPGHPVERAAENLLRRAGELGWHPTRW